MPPNDPAFLTWPSAHGQSSVHHPHSVATASLRELLDDDLDQHWVAWSAQHPHLAHAIDRVRLLDTAVDSLRQDPEFSAALRRAAG